MMLQFFKKHSFIFALALAIGFLVSLPNLFSIVRLGADFHGIFPAFTGDAYHYLGMLREAYDGHYNFGNVFIKEHKDGPYLIQPLAEIIFAVLSKIFGISVVAMSAINNFLLPFIGVLLIYFLLFSLLESRAIAGAFSVFYYLFFISLFGRPIDPQFSSLFLYTGLFLIWKIIDGKEKSPARLAIFNLALAVVFGVVFYIYPFAWTSILVVYGLALLFSILRDKNLAYYFRGLLFFAVPVLVFSIPYLLNLRRAIADINYPDVFLRFGFILNHYPSAFLNVLLMAAGLAIIYLSGKTAGIKQRIFVYSLALGGIILNWQNVITGKVLSFSPHYYPAMVLFLFIISAFCVSIRPRRWPAIILMVLALAFVFNHTGKQNWAGYKNSFSADISDLRDLQKFSELADWFNKNSLKDSAVYSLGGGCDWFIPTYTQDNVYFHCNNGLFLVSDDELENRWAVQNFFTDKIDAKYVENENMNIWASKFIERYQNESVRNKILNLFGIKTAPQGDLVPREYIDRVLEKVSYYKKLGFEKSLKQYDADYVLLYAGAGQYNELASKLRAYSFLKPVANIEDNLIFEVVK